jgi:hypothetical protein
VTAAEDSTARARSGARTPRALLVIAALLGARDARADAAANENASVAEALFRDGVALFDAGKVREACAKFAESYRLDPANGTLQNEALCHAREGRVATAWAEFALLAGRAAQAGQKDRERMARSQVEELERRLARVVLVFEPSTEVTQVTVDGDDLGRGAWSTPLPLDPGVHAFVFRAPHRRATTRSVIVPSGAATLRIVVPALEEEGPAAPVATAPPPAPPPVAEAPADRGGAQRTIALVTGGAGIFFLGAGTLFGLATLSKKHDVEAHCSGVYCDAEGLAADHDAHSDAAWATVGFAAGLGALGAATALWLTAPSSSSIGVAPTVGGAQIVGRF